MAESRRVLEPVERISEVLFGLIMVLTFTGSLSVAEAGRNDVRAMLIGALGCNFAWGLIDAIMYLMGCLSDRSQRLRTLHRIRSSTRPGQIHQWIRDALPLVIAEALDSVELEKIRSHLQHLPEPPARARLHAQDWRGAFGVFLLVFLSTFPLVLPFLFLQDARAAMRWSNGIAVAMLFVTGFFFGRCIGHRPAIIGIAMVLLGGALVAVTMALGG